MDAVAVAALAEHPAGDTVPPVSTGAFEAQQHVSDAMLSTGLSSHPGIRHVETDASVGAHGAATIATTARTRRS